MQTGIHALLCGVALCIPAQAAVRFFDASNPADVPQTISASGIYTDILAKQVDTALKYYEVNVPLWSDGSDKRRWIVLKPGRQVPYVDTTDLFTYPDSTIFVKNFLFQRVVGDPDSWVLFETRLLVNKNDSFGRNHWYGFSYKWNADLSDATLMLNGFDTLFVYYPGGLSQPQGYKKWQYPSQINCTVCHPVGYDDDAGLSSRGVAGFFPVQLKRPSVQQPGIDQVQWLFNRGVFSGSPPDSAQLRRRWRWVTEGIPAGLSAEERFRVIDTLARSYIGANCTACHGERGILAAAASPFDLNYDWYDFRPRIEFGATFKASLSLNVEDSLLELVQPSRYKYIQAVLRVGLDTSLGSLWHMSYPRDREPALVTTGHPAFSTLLYRQFGARNTPWMDSVEVRRNLRINGDPAGWSSWMFQHPWGSQAWREALAAHGVALDSVVNWRTDPYQMPRLATYIPDTTAMRVFGEWARDYRTLVRVPGQDSVVNVRGRLLVARADGPRLQGRVLLVPQGWAGKARMFAVDGRSWPLPSAGRGRYAIPRSAPPGVYAFRIGDRAFRAVVH
jgi:hypothetical protein